MLEEREWDSEVEKSSAVEKQTNNT